MPEGYFVLNLSVNHRLFCYTLMLQKYILCMIVFNCGKTRLYLLKISLFFKTENRLFDKIDTDLKNIYIYIITFWQKTVSSNMHFFSSETLSSLKTMTGEKYISIFNWPKQKASVGGRGRRSMWCSHSPKLKNTNNGLNATCF